jgi:dihydrofolate reductase
MRKIIVFNIISLDGYHTGPGNNVMVMPMGGVFDAYTIERLRAAETVLLGRVTYEMFRGFWPSVADDPSPEWTPAQREMSRFNNTLDKVVVSDSMTREQTEPWHNTRIIRRADAHQYIAELKRQPGKDILITGSHTLWNDLLAHDLVDELHLMIGNVILGGGGPVFEGKPDVSLRLIDIREWEDSDNVLVQYEVRHTSY